MKQTWNCARARKHCSRKISVRLWKNLWNTSKLGCGSKLSEGFPQNDVLCPHIGTFKPTFTWFNTLKLQNVATLRLKLSKILRKLRYCWFWLAEGLYRIPCLAWRQFNLFHFCFFGVGCSKFLHGLEQHQTECHKTDELWEHLINFQDYCAESDILIWYWPRR